jgi:hypothetical protein
LAIAGIASLSMVSTLLSLSSAPQHRDARQAFDLEVRTKEQGAAEAAVALGVERMTGVALGDPGR